MANVSLTHACYINLNNLDLVVKKWENFLQKKTLEKLSFPTFTCFM